MELNTRSISKERSKIYRTECPCENHYEKQLVERNYDLIVDKLFDLMFGTNEFVRTYRQAQRFYDDTTTEWTMNESTKCRERLLTYKMPFESTLVGKGTITTREKQVNIDLIHLIIEGGEIRSRKDFLRSIERIKNFIPFLHYSRCTATSLKILSIHARMTYARARE